MIKRIGLTSLVILVLMPTLFATSLDSVVADALEKSNAVISAKTTLESNELAVKKILAEENLSYSVSTGDITHGQDSFSSSSSSDFSINPNFTIYLNDDKDTTIDTETSLRVENGIISQNISSSISSTFDFNEEDTSTDMKAEMNLLEATYQYNKALLTVKGQLYNYISKELSYEEDLLKNQNQLIIDQNEYDQNIELGEYIATDLEAIKQLAKINYDQIKISQTSKYIKLIKEQFSNYAGFDYPDLDELEAIDLEFDMSKTNTPIEIAKAQVAIYEEEYRVIKEERNTITPSLGLVSDIDSTISLSGSADYSNGNWNLEGKVQGAYDFNNNSFTPYVSISGTYTSDSNTSKNTIEILAAKNLVESSKLSYQNELSNHSLEGLTLQNDIQTSNLELEQFELDNEVNIQNLENKQLLYDNGLVTETELVAAKNTVESDQLKAEILKISRFIIQNDIDKEFL